MARTFTSTSAAEIAGASLYRRHLSIYLDSNVSLHVLLADSGTVAANNKSFTMVQGDYWECPENYKGAVKGILSGAGTAYVTEIL